MSLVDIINDIGKPFVLHTGWTSSARQNDFEWFEMNNILPEVILDYSDQVKMYEATLHVLSDPEIGSVLKGLKPHGYFWNDQFDNYYPPYDVIVPASGAKGESIRNKPAEKVIKLWFEK